MKRIILALVAGLGLTMSIQAGSSDTASLDSLAQKAVSTNPKISAPAIASLRAKGPAGLEALLNKHAATIREHESDLSPASPGSSDAWQRVQKAIDSVSGQRDCCASRLFWYTDFEQAKIAAKASGKPILSLRLLGNLDEEYSCANSRFFRTTLYANTEVSGYLRDHFVLHWKSVRPVPRMTIDFGDGRKIERTITGNSIHYVLNSEGQPIDAIPGLYGPKAFLKVLSRAEHAVVMSSALDCASPEQFLKQYHNERYLSISSELNADLIKVANPSMAQFEAPVFPIAFAPPSALTAGRVAVSKGGAELPVLKSFQKKTTAANHTDAAVVEDVTWIKIAALHSEDAKLDNSSQNLLRRKNPTAIDASDTSTVKRQQEAPMLKALQNLQRSISEDTVRNEYQLHSQIHKWLANNTAPRDIDQLNAKVYAELFLTPDSDPWLGLAPAHTLTGLDNDGLVQVSPAR